MSWSSIFEYRVLNQMGILYEKMIAARDEMSINDLKEIDEVILKRLASEKKSLPVSPVKRAFKSVDISASRKKLRLAENADVEKIDFAYDRCMVCFGVNTNSSQALINCSHCPLRTHPSCYGVGDVSSKWCCEECVAKEIIVCFYLIDLLIFRVILLPFVALLALLSFPG